MDILERIDAAKESDGAAELLLVAQEAGHHIRTLEMVVADQQQQIETLTARIVDLRQRVPWIRP